MITTKTQCIKDLQVELFKYGLKADEREVNQVISKGIDSYLHGLQVDLPSKALTPFHLILNEIKS